MDSDLAWLGPNISKGKRFVLTVGCTTWNLLPSSRSSVKKSSWNMKWRGHGDHWNVSEPTDVQKLVAAVKRMMLPGLSHRITFSCSFFNSAFNGSETEPLNRQTDDDDDANTLKLLIEIRAPSKKLASEPTYFELLAQARCFEFLSFKGAKWKTVNKCDLSKA